MNKHDRLSKLSYPQVLNQASELVGKNPAITDREVCEILKISKNAYNKIKKDKVFYEKMETSFNKSITKDLLLVDVAMIREAQAGNVQAARYLAERHGKFVKKYQIEVKSPYELFAREVDAIEGEEVVDEIEASQLELPERDKRNDSPRRRLNEEKQQLHATLKKKKRESTPQYIADRADRYRLRKRAKAVGLEPLPKGKPTVANRDKWLNKLLKLEQEKHEKAGYDIKEDFLSLHQNKKNMKKNND